MVAKKDSTQVLEPTQITDDQHAYAIACCQKGLVKKLPELSFDNPQTVAEAFSATLIARPKNTQFILKYLWEVNPHVSWATQPILSRVATVSPKLAPHIFAHIFEAEPVRMKMFARNIAFQALRSQTPATLTMVLPYLSPSALRDLIADACKGKQLTLARMLVEVYPPEESLSFLKDLSSKNRQEVKSMLNEMQARRIHNSLKDLPSSRRQSATRKM